MFLEKGKKGLKPYESVRERERGKKRKEKKLFFMGGMFFVARSARAQVEFLGFFFMG